MRSPERASPRATRLAAAVLSAIAAGAALAQGGPVPPAPPRSVLIDPGAPAVPVPSAPAPVAAPATASERDGADALVRRRYEAGDYSGAARAGAAALAARPDDHALRAMVADSLAWSGRLDAAVEQYERLYGTPLDARGRVGVANVLRWRGRPEAAVPLYDTVIARTPDDAGAREGQALARRELRPQARLRLQSQRDSTGFVRSDALVSQRWWSDDRTYRYEVDGRVGRDTVDPDRESTAGAGVSVLAAGRPFRPALSLYTGGVDTTRVFGVARAELLGERLAVRAGRVDWGRMAFSMPAQRAGLAANTVGLESAGDLFFGSWRIRADAWRVSDGNDVREVDARLTPSWQPLPLGLAWFGGAYWRDSAREDPRYWSPTGHYTIGVLGLKRSWFWSRGELGVVVQRGFAIGDVAKDTWSGGLNAEWWLTATTAIGVDAWYSDAPRPADYRYRSVGVTMRQVW